MVVRECHNLKAKLHRCRSLTGGPTKINNKKFWKNLAIHFATEIKNSQLYFSELLQWPEKSPKCWVTAGQTLKKYLSASVDPTKIKPWPLCNVGAAAHRSRGNHGKKSTCSHLNSFGNWHFQVLRTLTDVKIKINLFFKDHVEIFNSPVKVFLVIKIILN